MASKLARKKSLRKKTSYVTKGISISFIRRMLYASVITLLWLHEPSPQNKK
jgi:hypothetical protein